MACKYIRYHLAGVGTALNTDQFVGKVVLPTGMRITPGTVKLTTGASSASNYEEPYSSGTNTTQTQVAHDVPTIDPDVGAFAADGGAPIDTVASYINYATGEFLIKEAGAVWAAAVYCDIIYEAENSISSVEGDWEQIAAKKTSSVYGQRMIVAPHNLIQGAKLTKVGKHTLIMSSVHNSGIVCFRRAGAAWPDTLANDVRVQALVKMAGAASNLYDNCPMLFARRDPANNTGNDMSGYFVWPYALAGVGSGIQVWAGKLAAASFMVPQLNGGLSFKPSPDTWNFAVDQWIGLRLEVTTEAPDVRVKVYLLIGTTQCEQYLDASPPWALVANFLHQGATYVNTPIAGMAAPTGSTYAPVLTVGGLGFACRSDTTGNPAYLSTFQCRK